ncbi:MAG: rod shape-determining protein MreD [Pseudomonadota bacterium]|nr:rod shape-determining protein MreD [Pseudomonadota bacterium]
MVRLPFLPRLGASGLVVTSLILAFVLTLVPMPQWAAFLRPQWVALVLIYWCMATPQLVGPGIAWMVGLLLDALTGSLLGLHGLVLATVAFVTGLSYQRVRMAPLPQQALWVAAVLLLGQIIAYVVLVLVQRGPEPGFFLTVAVSALIWPWLFLVLRDLRRASNTV